MSDITDFRLRGRSIVADEAEVSKALLPYSFDSKENLILLTMRWVLARVAQRIREAIAQVDSAEAKASAMIDPIFVGPESNRRFYLVFFDFLGYAARSDRFADVARTFHEICTSLYAEVVRLGQDEGVFSEGDAREAARSWTGSSPSGCRTGTGRTSVSEYREMCKRSVLTYLTAGA